MKKLIFLSLVIAMTNFVHAQSPSKLVNAFSLDQCVEYAQKNNKQYILLEITGQNDIQPMELRTSQGLNIINTIFNYYNIL